MVTKINVLTTTEWYYINNIIHLSNIVSLSYKFDFIQFDCILKKNIYNEMCVTFSNGRLN